MKYRVLYGGKPNISNLQTGDFSHDGYDCQILLQNKGGIPVVVSRSKELDIWKVQYGFSSVFFGTKAEALAYCRGRFYDGNGEAV